MQKGLKDNFADVQVSVVDCPDMTKEPFAFPVKGKQFLQFAFDFDSRSFSEMRIILSLNKRYCPDFRLNCAQCFLKVVKFHFIPLWLKFVLYVLL